MTREPPPLRIGVPIGALAGAAIGVIAASFYLTWALGFDLAAFDMLLVAKLSAIERQVYAEEMRHAYLGIAGMALLGAGLAAAATFRRRPTTYGDAHWQSRAELQKNGMLGVPGRGLLCAKLGPPRAKAPYVVAETAPHVMMIAPTRAGKGVGFVIPNLLTFEGSAVVLDMKGELFEATARWRGRERRPVFRFAPFDWEAETHRYNPLARVAAIKDPVQRHAEVRLLADRLLQPAQRRDADTFDRAGRQIFTAACKLAIQKGTPTLGAVADLVMGGQDTHAQFRDYAAEAGAAGDRACELIWLQQAKTSDRTLSSNIQALMSGGLDAWTDPAVRRATDASDFDFATFRRTRRTLYLGLSETHVGTLAPVMRVIFAELIAALREHRPGRDEPHAVMVMMDEFQAMGPMPFVEETIHNIAGYGGRFAIIAQSLAALDGLYSPAKRRSLEGGVGLRLFIAPRDEDTLNEVSRALGTRTGESVSRSYGRRRGPGGLTGQSVREEARPLLGEAELRLMDPDEVIVLVAQQMPIRAHRIKHYEDPTFTKITEAQEAYPWPAVRADEAGAAGPRAEETAKVGPAAKPATKAQEAAATPPAAERTTPPPPAPARNEGAGSQKTAPSKSSPGSHGDRPIEKRPRDEAVSKEMRARIRALEERMAELAEQLVAAVPIRREDAATPPTREAAGEEGAADAGDEPTTSEGAPDEPGERGAARRNNRLPL